MDRRAVLLLLATAGCRQLLGFEDPTQLATDANQTTDAPHLIDAAVDSLAPADCLTRWLTTPVFAPPTALAMLDTSADEDDPFLLPTELTIYFVRGGDLYTSRRSSLAVQFSAATVEDSLSSGSSEGKAFVSADGTRAFFASDRSGTEGSFDLWRGSRPSPASNFGVDQNYLSIVNDANAQLDPHLSTDLLRLYFAPSAGGIQHIEISERDNINQNFPVPSVIQELAGAGAGADAGPTLTDNERVIVFSSTRGGVADLYFSTRANLTSTFAAPKPVPQLNSTSIEGSPHISADGCRVYFMSTRNGTRDLFVAQML